MVALPTDKLCPFMSTAVPAMHRSPIAAPGTPPQQVVMPLIMHCAKERCECWDEKRGCCGSKEDPLFLVTVAAEIVKRLTGKDVTTAEDKILVDTPEAGE